MKQQNFSIHTCCKEATHKRLCHGNSGSGGSKGRVPSAKICIEGEFCPPPPPLDLEVILTSRGSLWLHPSDFTTQVCFCDAHVSGARPNVSSPSPFHSSPLALKIPQNWPPQRLTPIASNCTDSSVLVLILEATY